MVKNNNEVKLTIGSHYLIRSINTKEKPLETKGKYIGLAVVGQDVGFVMEMEDENIRVIPSHMILSIDILDTAEEKEEMEEEKAGYYG